LVAEDNPVNRLVVVGLLQSLGYTVQTVEDGRQALEAAGRGRFDLVLMDLYMPELDGVAATAAIRRREAEAGLAWAELSSSVPARSMSAAAPSPTTRPRAAPARTTVRARAARFSSSAPR
jgi:CheY-like chemotaxis protein